MQLGGGGGGGGEEYINLQGNKLFYRGGGLRRGNVYITHLLFQHFYARVLWGFASSLNVSSAVVSVTMENVVYEFCKKSLVQINSRNI